MEHVMFNELTTYQPEVGLEPTRPPNYKYGALPIKLLRHKKSWSV